MYGPDVEIIAHEITLELLARFPDPLRPLPTVTFKDDLVVELGGEKLELSYKGANHCPGNIFIYAPKQKALTKIDIVSPGSCTFMHCDASENISGWIQGSRADTGIRFRLPGSGGHIVRWGTREDVLNAQEYFRDMQTYVDEALLQMFTPDGSVVFFATNPPDHYSVGVENLMIRGSICHGKDAVEGTVERAEMGGASRGRNHEHQVSRLYAARIHAPRTDPQGIPKARHRRRGFFV